MSDVSGETTAGRPLDRLDREVENARFRLGQSVEALRKAKSWYDFLVEVRDIVRESGR